MEIVALSSRTDRLQGAGFYSRWRGAGEADYVVIDPGGEQSDVNLYK